MKKVLLSVVAFCIFFTACKQDNAAVSKAPEAGLQLVAEAYPAWQYENLRLYPIAADAAPLEGQADLSNLKTLAEGSHSGLPDHGTKTIRAQQRPHLQPADGAK
ncbi:MAG: hypothetical protein IPL27_21640 [Lewinellaceae bacterium]|nr:hypothetical protein [Lewinellaceae bacterium]